MSESHLSSTLRPSSRVADRYCLELSDCMVDWLDNGLTTEKGTSEFSCPVDARQWNDELPDAIWPALMMCDLLPLISNQSGDYLCGRVGSDNRINEIVYWFHGGGDWMPWGECVPDALVFDALRSFLPGPHHRHAEPARPSRIPSGFADDPLVQWACQRMPTEIQTILMRPDQFPASEIARSMLRHDICSDAVRLELIEAALFGGDVADLELARSLAFDVIRDNRCAANSMAWAWNVAGDCNERLGQPNQAIDCFARALAASNFSDQSVRLRHHWNSVEAGKYAADRLSRLTSDPAANGLQTCPDDQRRLEDEHAELMTLYTSPTESRSQTVMCYWIDRSSTAEKSGDFPSACRYMMQAGWDLGVAPLQAYERIISETARLASLAGQSARAAVARTHLACFRDRYRNC